MTTSETPTRRVAPGATLPPMTLETLAHGPLEVPGDGLVHLQFRRFAGCPVCNLHLRSFTRAQETLRAAGVQTFAFFHSSADSMRPFHEDLPFPTVPDPERVWYRRFGVERSVWGLLHPRVAWRGMRGMLEARSNPMVGGGGHAGLPADFLISPSGVVLDAHYGSHADDQWSVAQVLELAATAQPALALRESTG